MLSTTIHLPSPGTTTSHGSNIDRGMPPSPADIPPHFFKKAQHKQHMPAPQGEIPAVPIFPSTALLVRRPRPLAVLGELFTQDPLPLSEISPMS